jgi:hypothetical protein
MASKMKSMQNIGNWGLPGEFPLVRKASIHVQASLFLFSGFYGMYRKSLPSQNNALF